VEVKKASMKEKGKEGGEGGTRRRKRRRREVVKEEAVETRPTHFLSEPTKWKILRDKKGKGKEKEKEKEKKK